MIELSWYFLSAMIWFNFENFKAIGFVVDCKRVVRNWWRAVDKNKRTGENRVNYVIHLHEIENLHNSMLFICAAPYLPPSLLRVNFIQMERNLLSTFFFWVIEFSTNFFETGGMYSQKISLDYHVVGCADICRSTYQ